MIVGCRRWRGSNLNRESTGSNKCLSFCRCDCFDDWILLIQRCAEHLLQTWMRVVWLRSSGRWNKFWNTIRWLNAGRIDAATVGWQVPGEMNRWPLCSWWERFRAFARNLIWCVFWSLLWSSSPSDLENSWFDTSIDGGWTGARYGDKGYCTRPRLEHCEAGIWQRSVPA